MSIRKYRAARLFTGTEMLDSGSVLVMEGSTVEGIFPAADHEDTPVFDGLITPGFINCHCHLELSHMRGSIPERTGLVEFVTRVLKQRHAPGDEVLQSAEDAQEAMMAEGIVAVGDICNTPVTIPVKNKPAITYRNFVEVSGFVPATADQRFSQASEVLQRFRDAGLNAVITPHAPYSVSRDLMAMIGRNSGAAVLTMHNQETAAEDDFFRTGRSRFRELYRQLGIDISFFRPPGTSSLQWALEALQHNGPLILVHNTFTGYDDIEFAHQENPALYWCACPNANLYIENKLPPLDLLRQQGCAIILGTDSLASNHRLSILDEVNTILKHFPGIGVTEVLRWATLNGARALGLDNKLGSFEAGKEPGVIMLRGERQLALH